MSSGYKKAGVDVAAGYKAVSLMKPYVAETYREGAISGLGGFGGFFSLKAFKDMEEPVLVSGTDGVGTKLKLAFLLDKHDICGIDCVAMCVNDIICSGAQPLYFLDYIACGRNVPERIAEIVKGVSEGCKQANAALVGGETAEMPGFYKDDEYDLAGYATGIVDRENIIDGSSVRQGDVIIGLASSGLHSNGYSLVRRLLRPSELNINEYIEVLNSTLGNAILVPTRIYVKPILELIKRINVKGIANITGGGFIENIPRIIPDGLAASITEGTWPILPIFEYLLGAGDIKRIDMYNIFNMGIGMVVIADAADADEAVSLLNGLGEVAYKIGTVVEGKGIDICLK